MAEMLKQQKLQYLLASSIVANDLDAKAFYDSNASTSHIIYAHKNYADVPNDQYEGDKRRHPRRIQQGEKQLQGERRNPSRSLHRCKHRPSQADINQGRVLVDTTISRLSATPAVDAVNGDSNFGVDRNSAAASSITNPQLREFVTTAAPAM